MRFVLERVTGPSIEPVTLAEAKTHLRTYASDTSEDDYISGLITTARQWAESFTGRALIEQSWKLSLDRRMGNAPTPQNSYSCISGEVDESIAGWYLHKSPVISIGSFVSIDADGTETAIETDTYFLSEENSKWPRIIPVSSWVGDAFRITYRAGFAQGLGSPDPTPSRDDVPQIYKQAIKLYAEALYDRDEKMMPLLMQAAENLLKQERCELGMA